MKKTLLTALTVMAAMTATAADRVVYADGSLGGDYKPYGWWNAGFDFATANPDGEGNVFSFKAADGGAAASMGINAETDELCTGPLHSATLNFKWYATTAGQKYTIRLTSKTEQNYEITTTADNIGQWNTESLKLSEVFPTVAKEWNEYVNGGKGYVFSVIMDNGTAESVFYADDIRYTGIDEAWEKPYIEELPAPTTVPVPTHDAANVVSLVGSAYPQAATFNIGGWGQSTQMQEVEIDGKKALKITYFNYLGLEGFNLDVAAKGCNAMHVDFFAANEGNFGFTPISPAEGGNKEKGWKAETVKVGEWNSYDVPLSYFDVVDFSNVFQIKFDQGNGDQEGYISNVYFYKDEDIKAPEYGATWYGRAEDTCNKGGKDYFITTDYAFTALENGNIGFELTFDGEDDLNAGHQVHVVVAGIGDEWVTLTKEGDVWTGATTKFTLTPGQAVTEMEIYLPYDGGVYHPFVRDYVFGASNEKPVTAIKVRMTAEAQNITTDGAEIAYKLTIPAELADADVKVYYNDEVATANPIVITGLTPKTKYDYTLRAVATLGEEVYESEPVAVSFTTLRDGAEPMVWHTIADGMINNAYLPGEDPATARRAIPASIETTVTYNADQTITVDAIFHGNTVVGLVPQITISSSDYKFEYKAMTALGDNKYTITTDTEYPLDHNIGWLYFFLAYDGGASTINVNGYTTGMENEVVAYGEPASLELTLSATTLKVGETAFATAIVKDANNHYLLDEQANLTVNGAGFSIEGNVIKASDKGAATVTATAGELTATAEVKCPLTADAKNLFDANSTFSSATAEDAEVAKAFDDNEGTELVWNCADTEEHTLSVDLGSVRSIQAVELVWEGASATNYTVTLSNDATEQARATATGAVFTVENGQGGAGVTARAMLHNDDFSAVNARYVTLATTKAFAKDWGIKLKELRIFGTDDTSAVSDIELDSNAPVEYFNLQGVRVENPEAGLYIRRQGNTATKVYIK